MATPAWMRTPERFRDALLVLLALTTGVTDATAFERLGSVFASVITGNLILLGISAVRADGHLAVFAGCALAAYGAGVLVAAPRRGADVNEERRLWPAAATVALSGELAVLVAFAVFWELDGHAPARVAQAVMLALCAAAMGIQSTAVRRLGSMSTTYLTSTLTGLLEAVVARRWTAEHQRGLGIVLAAIAGAAAGVALDLHAPSWLPAVQLPPLIAVLVASRRLIGFTAR